MIIVHALGLSFPSIPRRYRSSPTRGCKQFHTDVAAAAEHFSTSTLRRLVHLDSNTPFAAPHTKPGKKMAPQVSVFGSGFRPLRSSMTAPRILDSFHLPVQYFIEASSASERPNELNLMASLYSTAAPLSIVLQMIAPACIDEEIQSDWVSCRNCAISVPPV